ncbi:hypothetical protein ACTWLI_02045 [Arthrobacter sp. Hor0625]|uniref:hypothetical protein n=1 Tax=Arthrobacter sp. Hor0625 TaxID=3457358 RepID=UPI00403E8A92
MGTYPYGGEGSPLPRRPAPTTPKHQGPRLFTYASPVRHIRDAGPSAAAATVEA